MDKNDTLRDLMLAPREVNTADVVISATKPAPLEVTIENIIKTVRDVSDFSAVGLRYELEHYRATHTKDKVFTGFRRKMKGVPVQNIVGDAKVVGQPLEIAACQGFCEISIDFDGHKFIAKANSPKNVPYCKKTVRLEAVKKIKKTIVLYLADKQRSAK